MTISADLVEQTELCFNNTTTARGLAATTLEGVVRVMYILADGAEFPKCWPVLRKYLGAIRPAATMIAAGLADPRIRIEIEVTARRTGS
jgi:enamine deaminase RidA (YjgF/YER057c/UK114 family)